MGDNVYKPRIVETVLKSALNREGAVLVEGTKACGKTTTCAKYSQSSVTLDDAYVFNIAENNPEALLNGPFPRMIDEWQLVPQIWDVVRHNVDNNPELGRFILTGSSVPPDRSEIHHTGAGRFARIRMRPMTLWESGDSSGQISLSELFSGNVEEKIFIQDNLTLEDIAYLTCRGGWPRILLLDKHEALAYAKDYLDTIIRFDASRANRKAKNSVRIQTLLRSLARHQGTSVSNAAIIQDLETNYGMQISRPTFLAYLNALEEIFIIEDSDAWNPKLRSKTAIRQADTHYFVDPSIGAAALEAGPQDLIQDLNTFGFLFETLCIHDLRVYAQPLRGTVHHFRTQSGLECDAVVHLGDGRYGLVEIKLGGEQAIEKGASTLIKIAGKIDTDHMNPPSFLMVLTGTQPYAFRRSDGVYVVPVGVLRD